jgi:predicted ATPase/GAF domain-containing protein
MIELKGYSITGQLSQSQTRSVYRGVRESDSAPVVVKVLDIEFPTPIQLARIRHEYDLVNDLVHKGIIKVHALEKVNNSLAIVMEDFGGEALKSAIAENKNSIGNKLKIARQVCEILGEIHSKGIVHKDINSNNILLNPRTEEIKIIDFGNASVLSHEDRQIKNPDHLEGTLAYIAPEQTGRMNRPVDYRSDYYSLGITLYELFLNKLPFDANDSMELVHLHIASVPPSIHSQDSTIPKAVSLIVQKLIEKNAENRYQSAIGICRDFDICIDALNSGESTNDFSPGRYDVSDKFSIPAKLYGREKEVGTLMDAYERACDGKPGVMLVTGYSGIGKSSLISEIHKPIAKRRGLFISGKHDQYRRNIPYSALIQAFQNLMQQILAESDESIASLRERLLATFGGNGQVMIDVIPELRHIIGPQPEVPPLAPQEAQNRFNFYFINFVQIFAQAEHPLALFLDDLQWADNPSLNLLELLSAEASCKHLLIIGAYRENEVDASHPLLLSLGRMRSSGLTVDEIALRKLPQEVVHEMTADTFNCSKETAHDLAALVYRKTDGNPFFIGQLLKNLHDAKLVSYDHSSHAWTWDIAKINQVGITDNVVELMAGNIRKLSSQAQELLKLAACIGNRFTLRDLSVVSEKTSSAIAEDFKAALKAELIIPIGEEYKFIGGAETDAGDFDVRYRFLHDRVQQAAHDLLSEDEKAHVHLRVGKLFLGNTPPELLDAKLFDIVNHFNQATGLINEASLKLQLAELNMKAAVKAKNSIAYEPALKYIKIAQTYLDGLQENPRDLSFNLLVEQAECEHLNSNGEVAEKLYHQALAEALSQDEKAKVYEALIHYYTNTGNFKSAYHTGRQALKLFRVSLPASFIPPLFIADFIKAKWLMRGKKIADLINLPLCKDENMRTAMRLIGALLKAAYQIRPELCIANAVKAVNLSLQHGTMEDNAVAYVVFGGIFVGGVMGNHQSGYEFGQLALAMNNRFNNLKQRSEVNFVSGYFTDFWLKPARNTEEYYRAAYENGLQTGDFFHISCAACTMVESQLIRGVPLPEVQKLGNDYLAFMLRIKNQESAGAITAVLRSILNLEGLTESPDSFADSDFNEQEFVAHIKGFTSLHFTHFYFVNKMQTLYLWGRYAEAMKVAQESEKYLKYSLAMLHTVEHHFYHALVLCAVYGLDKNPAHLNKAQKILKKFEKWAQLNPANFEHKALLIRAEVERHTQDNLSIAKLYNEAIKSADENGYIQNKALGNELAGRFFAAKNVEMAALGHMREAIYGYQVWGAKGIADKLGKEFPLTLVHRSQEMQAGRSFPRTTSIDSGTVRMQSSTHTVSHTTTSGSGKSSLDMETVIKSTQAISGEIKLSSLLQKLMNIIIENAGAEKGCFIRVEHGQLLMEAEAAVNESEVRILGGQPLDGAKVAVSIVQYVARTGDSVVLSEAHSDTRFGNDPYVIKEKPVSVLCSPVIHQGKVIGIIYLENNLANDVFTPQRLEMLNMLSAQAAISLENSLLYANLEQRVLERTNELKTALGELEVAHETVHSSIQYASRIQRAILPPEDYFSSIVPEHFVLWEPRDVVGGDMYWCKPWGDGCLIILGDCTGHGVPGAFMTMLSTGALESALREITPGNVGALLQRMHGILQNTLNQGSEHGHSDDGIEMGVCYLNSDKTKMTFAGARFDLYILDNGEVKIIKGSKSGMGYRGIPRDQQFETQEIIPDKSMIFYLASDGVVDQTGANTGYGAGRKRMMQWIVESGNLPLAEQKAHIYNSLLAYQGNAKRRDDVSLIGFKI